MSKSISWCTAPAEQINSLRQVTTPMNQLVKIHPGGVIENSPGQAQRSPGKCSPIRGLRPVGALRTLHFASCPLGGNNE